MDDRFTLAFDCLFLGLLDPADMPGNLAAALLDREADFFVVLVHELDRFLALARVRNVHARHVDEQVAASLRSDLIPGQPRVSGSLQRHVARLGEQERHPVDEPVDVDSGDGVDGGLARAPELGSAAVGDNYLHEERLASHRSRFAGDRFDERGAEPAHHALYQGRLAHRGQALRGGRQRLSFAQSFSEGDQLLLAEVGGLLLHVYAVPAQAHDLPGCICPDPVELALEKIDQRIIPGPGSEPLQQVVVSAGGVGLRLHRNGRQLLGAPGHVQPVSLAYAIVVQA